MDNWKSKQWYVPESEHDGAHYVTHNERHQVIACSCNLYVDTQQCDTAIRVANAAKDYPFVNSYLPFYNGKGTWIAQFIGKETK